MDARDEEFWETGRRRQTNTERVWVQVEIDAGPQSRKILRGQMSTEDFEAIVGGTFRGRFFRITNAYWFDTVHDAEQGRTIRRMVVAGRDDIWQRFTGVFYLPVNAIACLSTMWDCDDVSPDEMPAQDVRNRIIKD